MPRISQPFWAAHQNRNDEIASGEWILVRARAVYRGDGNVQLAQIHRQLAAMVVPVVQHDRPQERQARQREHFTFAVHHPPRRHYRSVIHAAENPLRFRDALVERRD